MVRAGKNLSAQKKKKSHAATFPTTLKNAQKLDLRAD